MDMAERRICMDMAERDLHLLSPQGVLREKEFVVDAFREIAPPRSCHVVGDRIS